MSQLPVGGPMLYRRIGALVLHSWSDVALREALRDASEVTLARRGIELPPGMKVRVVPLWAAELPTSRLLELPLPAQGSPPVAPDEARRLLEATPFHWLCGGSTQLVSPDAVLDCHPSVVVGRSTEAGAGRVRHAIVGALSWRGRVALGGAALAASVAAALVMSGRGAPPGHLSLVGLARPAAAAFALSVAVVALLSMAVARRRR